MAKEDQDSEVLRLCRLYERTEEKWRPFHEKVTKHLDFALRLKHYRDKGKDDPDADANVDRIAPKGRELYQQIEHKAGLISRSKLHFELLPVNQTDTDPPLADAAKSAMRWELFHPLKRYQECRDRMVMGALAAPAWALEIAFNPDLGPFGEIVFREKDPRGIAWADGFLSMHDLECPWVMDWCYMPTVALRAKKGKPGWSIPDDLQGDPEPLNSARRSSLTDIRDSRDQSDDEARNLVVRFWERGIHDQEKRPVPGSLVPLDEGQRWMACDCGFQSPNEEQMGQSFPEMQPDGCPDCAAQGIAGDLTRIDGVEQESMEFKWPGKKRLRMFLPRQRAIIFEDGWPFDIPTVPFIYCVLKPHPAEADGMSETSTNWTMQTSSNMVIRSMLEQAMFMKPWFLTHRDLEAADGQPWQWGRNQGVGIYWRGLGQIPTPQAIQGSAVPNGSVALLQAIQGVFLPNMGRSDIPLAPGESKDIAVGTVKQLIESGEIPTDHAIERLRRAETPGLMVLYQLIRKTYTPARVVRMQGPTGKWMMLTIHGDNLGAYDVIATAEPDFSRLQAEELQAIGEFAMLPPHIQYFAAERLNIPPEAVARLQMMGLQMGQPAPTDLPLPLQRRMGGAFNGSGAQPQNSTNGSVGQ